MKKIKNPRLPMEGVLALRSKGGPNCSPKGKKGYNRKREKKKLRKGFEFTGGDNHA